MPEIAKLEFEKANKKKAVMIVFSPRRMAKKYLGIANKSTTNKMTRMLERLSNNMPDGWFMRKVTYPRKTIYYAIRRIQNESDDKEIHINVDRVIPGHTHYV